MNTTVTNLSDKVGGETPRMSIEKAISLNLLIFIIFIGFVSNAMILFAITYSKYFKRPANYMIGNLVLSSIAQLFGVFIFYIFKRGTVAIPADSWWICRILPVVLKIPVPVEVFSILFLALDRVRVVKSPLDKETCTSAKKKIILAWLAGILMESPQALFWKWREAVPVRREFQCYNTRSYGASPVLWIVYVGSYGAIAYVLPSCVLLISLYNLLVLLRFVRRTTKAARDAARPQILIHSPVQRKLETLRNAALFIVQFLITKLPPGIWRALYDLPIEYVPEALREALVSTKLLAMILFSFNFALNPLLVFIISRDIREYYWRIFACKRKTKSEAHRVPAHVHLPIWHHRNYI